MERVIIDKSDTVLEIEVKTNVSKAIKDMDKLFRSLKKLEKIDVSNIEVLNKINSSNLIKIEQEIKSLNSEINRLQKTGTINFTSVANGLDSKNSPGIDTNILDKQADSCIVLSDYISGVSLDFEKLIQDMASVDSLGELDKMFGNMLSNAFGPFRAMLDDTLQHVIGFTQKVTEALGAIFGWKFEVDSTAGTFDDWSSNAQNVAASTGVAAKNVEKMSKGVRAFDELNVIKTQDNSYSSGGVGNSGASIGGEFVKTKTIWDNYKSDIDTLSKLGSYIGETLTKALNQINWSRIYEGARNFGKGLADFLNALISPDLFGAVGQTIAKALNTAIYAALSFGQNFDFENFGYSIASAINNFFANFDFKALAQTLNTWVNGVKQIIVTAITNIHWGDVFKGIGTFFSNLDVNATFLLMIPAIKKLYPLLDNIVLTFTALSGNTAALSKLTEAFPKLGKAVKVASDSLLYLKMGIQDKQLFTGLNLGIENIRENLTGLQKGIIGTISVVGEFKAVKSAFSDIAKGTDNLGASIGKITARAGLASVALYTAFGPAGLAVAAITGVVAAISGIRSAFDEMSQEFVNATVFDGMGISISKIAENVANVIQLTGTTSETMQGFSDKMLEIRGNIENASTSIDNYRLSLERTGGLSEEQIGGMKTGVDNLASSLKENLEYNTNIAFSTFMNMSEETANKLGIDVEKMTGILSQFKNKFGVIYDDIQAEADAIMDKMLNGAATDEDIEKLNGLLDDLQYLSADAIKRQIDLKNSVAEMLDIDYESLEGTTSAIQNIKDAGIAKQQELETYYSGLLEQVGIWQEETRRALEIGRITDEEAALYYNWLDNLTTTYNNNWDSEKSEIEAQINTTYDYIAAQLAEAGTKVYEKAQDKDRGLLGAFGLDTIISDVDNFAQEIYTPTIEAINQAKQAINPKAGEMGTEMWDNYHTAVREAQSETGDLYDIAVNEIEGYKRGIKENSETATNAMIDLFGGVINGAKEKNGINSPSTVFKEIGMYCVFGFNEGIEENKDSSLWAIENLSENIFSKFSEIGTRFAQIGIDAMNGLYDGLSSVEGDLYHKSKEIADNIANTIRSALDINSPSKVMFKLGDYTMQGFKKGLEALYQPILLSLGIFSSKIAVESMPKFSRLYNNYQGIYVSDYQLSNVLDSGYMEYYKQDNTQTNILLRELLSAVRKGSVIEVNGQVLGKTVRREAREYYSRTGQNMLTF